MHQAPLVAYPTDTLYVALQRMTRSVISGLPVVDRERPDHLLGFVSLTDVARVLDLQANELAARPEAVRSAADDPLRYVAVEEAMSRTFETVQAEEPLEVVAARLAEHAAHAALIVDADGALAGIVTVDDLERAAADDPEGGQAVGAYATRSVVTARAGEFIADALAQPGAEAARQLPVVTQRDGLTVPIGLLRRSDVVVAYLRGRERLRSTQRATRLGSNGARAVVTTEVPIERTDVANGRTLAELNLPRDAVVTAVERDGSLLVPRGQLRLLAGDRVRLLSNEDEVEQVFARLRLGQRAR